MLNTHALQPNSIFRPHFKKYILTVHQCHVETLDRHHICSARIIKSTCHQLQLRVSSQGLRMIRADAAWTLRLPGGYSLSSSPFSHGFKYCRHLGDVETHLSSVFDRPDEGVVCQCFTNPSRPQTRRWHTDSHEPRGSSLPSWLARQSW